jgi:transposase
MSEITTVGLDLAENVFQIHGADGAGRAVLRKKLRRAQVLEFFSQLPSCVVAMEACGGAHYWGREIGKLGHEVRLIPPSYVKPFVKRQKNDAADAEAICEANSETRRLVEITGWVCDHIRHLARHKPHPGCCRRPACPRTFTIA